MHSHVLLLFHALTLGPVALGGPVVVPQADPSVTVSQRSTPSLQKRVEASSYPYGDALENEFLWRNWDKDNEDDKKDGERIHKAFVEWHDFAKQGYTAGADNNTAPFKRWMGAHKSGSEEDIPKEVRDVFGNMIDHTTWKATANIKKMVLDRKDFKGFCKGSTTAYTWPDTGEFHVCPFGLKRPLDSELSCDAIEMYCSRPMRSMPMFLLHEMTHFNDIGAAARGGLAITDQKSKSYQCFKIDDEEKPDNAQNYAWLAGDAYWSDKCNKPREDPPPGTEDDSDDADDFAITLDPLPAGPTSPPAPPPPPPNTKSLQVMQEQYIDEISNDMHWNFFAKDIGQKVDPCKEKATHHDWNGWSGDIEKPSWPKGEWKMKLWDHDCTYRGDEKGPGFLNCGYFEHEIDCKEENEKKETTVIECPTGLWSSTFHRVAVCEWN